MIEYSLVPMDGQSDETSGVWAPRVVVVCNGDIAVAQFDDGDRQVIRMSDDYGQRTPGEDSPPEDHAPVPLGTCRGVLIVLSDPRSARAIERVARLAAEKLESPSEALDRVWRQLP